MLVDIFKLIKKIEERIKGNPKVGISVGSTYLIFSAIWPGGILSYEDRVNMVDISYVKSYEVYINYFVTLCNNEYNTKENK